MKNETVQSYVKIHSSESSKARSQPKETKHIHSTVLAVLGGPGRLQFPWYICPWQITPTCKPVLLFHLFTYQLCEQEGPVFQCILQSLGVCESWRQSKSWRLSDGYDRHEDGGM